MGIGIFFLVLFVLIIAALPIGGVFSFLSMLPHLANQAFSFGVMEGSFQIPMIANVLI